MAVLEYRDNLLDAQILTLRLIRFDEKMYLFQTQRIDTLPTNTNVNRVVLLLLLLLTSNAWGANSPAFVGRIDSYNNIGDSGQLAKAINDTHSFASAFQQHNYNIATYFALKFSRFLIRFQEVSNSILIGDIGTLFYSGVLYSAVKYRTAIEDYCFGRCSVSDKPSPGQQYQQVSKVSPPVRETLRTTFEGPEMVRIHAPKPYLIGRYEVTFEEYDRFARAMGRRLPDDKGWGRGKRPVIRVSWKDAVAHAEWLSKQTGKRYRLPTEAEWAYAAKAGTKTEYWWGEVASHEFANYGKNKCCGGLAKGKDQWVYTAPVGSFKANPFGVFDTAGNVDEWVQDCNYKNCSGRVIRGGSWFSFPKFLRSTSRIWGKPGNRNSALGFRLAQDIE